MNIFLDFETYYDKDYSLRKMTTIEYVRDPRFKILGCAIALDTGQTEWYHDTDVETRLKPWLLDHQDRATIICHNAYFDGLILTERLGIKPAKWGCTLSMARAALSLPKYNLNDVSKAFGLQGKVTGYLTEGANEADAKLIEGGLRDVDLCRSIYNILLPAIPPSELNLIDLTIRCGVEGRLELNEQLLEESLAELKAEREQIISDSGYTEAQLSSNQQFAEILRSLNIEPPQKISQTTGNETDAFSKNDPEFQQLMADYPDKRPLWEGRLAAKSTIDVTRTEKLLRIARLNPKMPMPLNYWGAKNTGRWSGSDGLNVQNLPKKGRIREAFRAPKGWKIIAPDSNKIELRINLWFSRQKDILKEAAFGDIYKAEAARQFNIDEDEVTKDQRQFGKVIQLGLGFQMGWFKFRNTCASGPLGMAPIHLTIPEAQNTVTSYRNRHYAVQDSWYFNQNVIGEMMYPKCSVERGPVRFVHNGIMLPGDMMIQYPALHPTDNNEWVYGLHPDDCKNTRIYGGKIQENIVQALARKVIADQMLEIAKDLVVVSMTHDEVICLVRENEAEAGLKHAIDIMSKPPTWAPDLPLGAEGDIKDYYGK